MLQAKEHMEKAIATVLNFSPTEVTAIQVQTSTESLRAGGEPEEHHLTASMCVRGKLPRLQEKRKAQGWFW